MFDWPSFFEENNIEYVTSRNDLKKNNIGIKCPWCGDDPSYHMGISLEGKGYSCWRNRNHKGIAPQRLIVELIGCSYHHADSLVKSETVGFITSDDTFAEDGLRALGMHSPTRRKVAPSELSFLEESKPLQSRGLAGRLALDYLKHRKGSYSEPDALWLGKRYDLRFSLSGKFAYRIIVPIYLSGKLVNWTGRAVNDTDLRYLSLSDDPERSAKNHLPTAPVNIHDCLLDYDRLTGGGRILVVCEGPFDAMRVGFFANNFGIEATCLFSKILTPAQLALLSKVRRRFDKAVLLLDKDAAMEFSFPDYLNFQKIELPSGVKDPGDMSRQHFYTIFRGSVFCD
jgi:hypothetical protein